MTRKRRSLSNNELIRVSRFLDANRGLLEGKPPERILSIVRDEIGIDMTRNNLEGIRDIEGYDWVIPRQARRPAPAERDRILSQALVDIYAKLGEEVPEELAALAED